MANTKSAEKRARQTTARTLRNRRVLTNLRTLKKRSGAAGTTGDTDVRALISALDKAAKRGIIHKNVANRGKARLKKSLAPKPTPAPATPEA
jgi:small subunit ribosomal protein S20